ncbi:DUF485 domain-containing protein [Saccharopolyspora taberi]|uniref:DUF485 domain-containing protein n=1 Tax=Saccharopolyspora taberi TaxID=60895 RepID=A0ABN3VEX0_9PSEU
MVAPSPGRPAGTDSDLVALARRRRRLALGGAALLLAGFLGYIALTTSTTVLSGRLAGLGTAYWAGFAIFAAILAVAHAYARWARRMDALAQRSRGEAR